VSGVRRTTKKSQVPEESLDDYNNTMVNGIPVEDLFVTGVPMDSFEQLSELPMASDDEIDERMIPLEFDARTAWPNRPSIGQVRKQGMCGSWYVER
jgi:hypothetical protein